MSLNTRSQFPSNQKHLCKVCLVKCLDLIFLFTLSIFIIIIIHQFIFSVKIEIWTLIEHVLQILLLLEMCQSSNIKRLQVNLESTRPSERKEISSKQYLIRELIPLGLWII